MAGRIWLGLIFLFFGIGLLLHQMEIIHLGQVLSNWWPVIFIIIGVIQFNHRTSLSAITGVIFVLIGLFFFAQQWFNMNLIAYFWPIIFIVFGFSLILTRVKQKPSTHRKGKLNSFVLFSGTDVKSYSQPFPGGNVTAVFGHAEIDLRDAVIAEGAVLDVSIIFGGVTIRVPKNVRVEIIGTPIFGGWEDSTEISSNDGEIPVLKINCLTIFGGAEIKN